MASFDLAIPTILANEGGYVNDPADPGGETNFGISRRSYPDVDIRNLTRGEAMMIYQRDFWKYDGVQSQELATKVLDTCVNLGQTGGMSLCQKATGTRPDGRYGALTEGAFNGSPEDTLSEIRKLLVIHYDAFLASHPALEKDRNGLMRRARQ